MRILLGLWFLLWSSLPAFAKPGDPPIEACFDVDGCMAKCNRGVPVACLRAGELYGSRGQNDRVDAMMLKVDKALAKQCDAKDARACFLVGDLTCKVSASNDASCTGPAAARFKKGCDLTDGSACAMGGLLALKGLGGEAKDATRAKLLLDRAWLLLEEACTDGVTRACMDLGTFRSSDLFGARDKAVSDAAYLRAVPLLSRDCQAGDASGCYWAARFFENGLGTKANVTRGTVARSKLCKLAPKATDCKLGTGAGPGTGGNTTKPGAAPTITIGEPQANGSLDKNIIRRYIKRNLQKIQYCYEKELLNQPGLTGTAMIEFTIEGDGKVSSAIGSGLPKVDACVATIIKDIEFPKPVGGGKVIVRYPFQFRPAGN